MHGRGDNHCNLICGVYRCGNNQVIHLKVKTIMEICIKAKMTDGSSNWVEDFRTEFDYMPKQQDVEKYVQNVLDVFNRSRREDEEPRRCVEVISWEQIKEPTEIQIGARTLADVAEIRKTLTDMEDNGNVMATGAKIILQWLVEGDDSVLDYFEEES